MTENKISSELQHLVYWAVDILGKATPTWKGG